MHGSAGHRRAPRALLATLVTALAALVLLPRAAGAQADDCPILQPNCETSTTVDEVTSTTRERATSTTSAYWDPT